MVGSPSVTFTRILRGVAAVGGGSAFGALAATVRVRGLRSTTTLVPATTAMNAAIAATNISRCFFLAAASAASRCASSSAAAASSSAVLISVIVSTFGSAGTISYSFTPPRAPASCRRTLPRPRFASSSETYSRDGGSASSTSKPFVTASPTTCPSFVITSPACSSRRIGTCSPSC